MRRVVFCLGVAALVAGSAPAARADHTNPTAPLAPTTGAPAAGVATGLGTWTHIRNFPANPGTDQKFFKKGRDVYLATGTLGQADENHVGQRIIRLTNGSAVDPQWVFDHGSANCPTANPGGTTGLQHDTAVTPRGKPELVIDSTDATGRCHDPGGGGLELVDVSGIHRRGFVPREIHITRHRGFSHTVTVDATRPWIVYNSTSDFAPLAGNAGGSIDVLDIRTCLGLHGKTLAQKRAVCRPKVHRINFEPDWSRQINFNGQGLRPGSEASCHDITAVEGRIYCAALNSTLVFDVANLAHPSTGDIQAAPLMGCTVINGTTTAAAVTDCGQVSATIAPGTHPQGWRFLGTINHPGRNDGNNTTTNSNTNLVVRSNEGVAVSHEADPTPDGRHMMVSDERGGGVVPGGATCTVGLDNPFGNGGLHFFNITDTANITYARKVDGTRAVWIGATVVSTPTFCTVHVFEHVLDEQRVLVGYYNQGTKILDYFIDGAGRFTFRETAGYVLPGAATWTSQAFKIVDNANGTRTYFFASSDIARGVDIFSWTGPKNVVGSAPPAASGGVLAGSAVSNLGLAAVGLVVLPVAYRVGRRRQRHR